ncbi:hypothetical protein OY671_007970, partial [Metschnikowia pulcherrima]
GETPQEIGPEHFRFRWTDCHAEHLAPAVAVDADRDGDSDRDDPSSSPHFEIGGIDPDIGPVTLDRSFEERFHTNVDLFAEPAHSALGDAAHAHGSNQIIDRACRYASDVGLSDDGSQRLLRHPARFEEAGEITALPELGDAQLDGAGTGLPIAIPIAVASNAALDILLAVRSAGQPTHFQLHQPLRGKADHVAQKIGVRALPHKRSQVHHVIGHR